MLQCCSSPPGLPAFRIKTKWRALTSGTAAKPTSRFSAVACCGVRAHACLNVRSLTKMNRFAHNTALAQWPMATNLLAVKLATPPSTMLAQTPCLQLLTLRLAFAGARANSTSTTASSLGQAVRESATVTSLDLTKSPDLLCVNLMCEKVGEPCICRLSNVLERLQLECLNLSSNNLSSLPESIGRLVQLRQLDLSCNNLTTLPSIMQQLTQLKVGRVAMRSQFEPRIKACTYIALTSQRIDLRGNKHLALSPQELCSLFPNAQVITDG